jgi:hypothetical protein
MKRIFATACIAALAFAPAAGQDHYLRGSQLAELYTKYLFCYDPQTYSGRETCSSIEQFQAQTPSVLRITSRSLIRFRARSINSFGDAIGDAILNKTVFQPEGYEATDVQTQTIVANGLCRTRQTEVQDDYLMEAVMVADLSKPWENRTPASPENVAKWRDNHARADQNEIGYERCARYTVFQTQYVLFGSPRYLLGEDEFMDGAKQPGPATKVKLYPLGSNLYLRAP